MTRSKYIDGMSMKAPLLILVAVATVSISSPLLKETRGAGCPEGWVDGYPVNIGCLLFSTSARTHWGTANNFCQFEAGGTLAEVATEIQFDFVRTHLGLLEVEGSNMWWLSGTDVGVNGVWKWATSYSPVGDFVWTDASPPIGHRTQNCLALNHTLDFMGSNTHCDTTGAFPICQIKPFWKL